MNNFFDRLNDSIRNVESSFVNFISAIAPWLAPLTPAYMSYQHASGALQLPPYIAYPYGAVVEILGFSAVSTYLSFYFYNRKIERTVSTKSRKGKKTKTRRSSRRAPIEVVVFAFLFYLALILASNVILDAYKNAEWAINTVRALATLQTVPAALIVAVRTQHRDLLSSIARERSESNRKVSEESSVSEEKVTGNFPGDWRKVRPFLSKEEVLAISKMSTADILDKYHLKTDKTARNWRSYAQEEVNKDLVEQGSST